MKLIVKRHFDAAHRLRNYKGPCNRLHGHTWKVEVELEIDVPNAVTGDAGYYKGVTIDFKKLKRDIDRILPDHQYVNDLAEWEPTAENLAIYFRMKLIRKWGLIDPKRVCVRVWESEDCAAEASG